ncbi:SRPBCC domain-containing protein [Kytococcus sedentarius]|uniref:SRPBCC family protein n=1 Tax=Kytococcus sedentarius TaxID=1276 RepID=UPI0035BC6A86
MPVIDTHTDPENCSLTITAEFAAPVERLWQVYADPRQLEKIWGPPEFPATVVDHDLTPGGRVTYYMAGPDGERYHGFWDVKEVQENQRIRIDEGFANPDFTPAEGMPVADQEFTFSPAEGGSRLVAVATYGSAEELQQVVDMGAVEGATGAMNQIDALVA